MITDEEELDNSGRHPKLWSITAVNWVLENPNFTYQILIGSQIKEPAKEIDMTKELESMTAPDLDHAIEAAHQLLEKYIGQAGELGIEISLVPPQPPHADQERLGIKDYKLAPEARKQARAIGLRGRDIEARVARMVRHSAPFDHKIANRRFRGIILRIENDVVVWIDLAVRPRRRRKSK
jgi:hypothetical protein